MKRRAFLTGLATLPAAGVVAKTVEANPAINTWGSTKVNETINALDKSLSGPEPEYLIVGPNARKAFDIAAAHRGDHMRQEYLGDIVDSAKRKAWEKFGRDFEKKMFEDIMAKKKKGKKRY